MTNKSQNVEKPYSLRVRDTKTELYKVVNTALDRDGLPFSTIEFMLNEILAQIKIGVNNELTQAESYYAEMLAQAEEALVGQQLVEETTSPKKVKVETESVK